jgi:hypothetical protein
MYTEKIIPLSGCVGLGDIHPKQLLPARSKLIMAQTTTRIQAIADKLMKDARIYPGEHGYVSRCIQTIYYELEKFYNDAGVQPPARKTIEKWFERDCPDWAIAILNKAI